jgi:hypothetical protein
MKTLGILFALLLFATESLPQPIVEARPTAYSHLLDPSLYPDYTRHPSRTPAWATSLAAGDVAVLELESTDGLPVLIHLSAFSKAARRGAPVRALDL